MSQATPAPAHRKTDWNLALKCYAVLLPTFLLLLVFNYIPIASAFVLSFFDYELGGTPSFAGLNNFIDMFDDDVLMLSFSHLLQLVVFAAVVRTIIPMLVATLIFHLRSERSRYAYRMLLVLPMVVPGVALILIWGYIYNDAGILTELLTAAGLQSWVRPWLSDPNTALYALMFVGFPFVSGFDVLIFYAGLIQIPGSVFDACRIDGAKWYQRFFHVELPLITAQLKLVLTFTIIVTIQGFELMLILTNGGPGYETMVPGLQMYREAFSFQRMGYACAIGMSLFFVILLTTLVTSKVFKSSTEYEGGRQ